MTKPRLSAIFLFLFILFNISPSPATASAASADVQAINGRAYYPAVKNAIQHAKKSIYMIMYQISLSANNTTSQVHKLVDELLKAHERGVKVKVILDQNVDFVRKGNIEKWSAEGKNAWCYKVLKDAGIDVSVDDLTSYTHAKAIVIDGELVILGSANWSISAFSANVETNVLIVSKELAKQYTTYFDQTKIGEPPAVDPSALSGYVPISWKFLESSDLAGRMLSNHDERVFDVYLLLLKYYDGNPEAIISFDFDEAAGALGLGNQMNRTAYRRQLIKTLKKLDQKYKLIKFIPKFAKNAIVILLGYDNPTKAYSYPKTWFFKVPDTFWAYGWNQALSFPAKYCYLINLAYVSISNSAPWWYSSREVLEKRFKLSQRSISAGMGELRRLNLIDVAYSAWDTGSYRHTKAKEYKVLSLYDPKWLESEWKRLAQAYSEKALNKALKYAKIVYKENDSRVVEDIITSGETYGHKAVKNAFNIVAKKAIDNPKRNYAYVRGILKKMGK